MISNSQTEDIIKADDPHNLKLDSQSEFGYVLPNMSEIKSRKAIINILKWAIVCLILYFIFDQIGSQWSKVKAYHWQINWPWLGLSLLTLMLALFLKSCLWAQVLQCFGINLSVLRAFRVAYLSNLGRYIPGKVMQFVGIMYLAKKEGIREDISLSSLVLIQLLDTSSGLVLMFAYGLILGTSFQNAKTYWPILIVLGLIAIASLVIIMMPSVLEKLLNKLLKLLRQPTLEFKLRKKTGFKLLFLYFVTWNIFGVAYYLFLQAVTDIPAAFLLQACVIYTGSYLIGYWAVFAPGGIGVREGAMGIFLAQIGKLLTSVALAVSLAARLWFLAAELLVSVLALAVRSKK